MRNLKLFGVELEGGWDIQPPGHEGYHEDGSVNVRGTWRIGEIVSRPIAKIGEGMRFIKDNYPQHMGTSCGLHVHMSFVANEYCISLLADTREYLDSLIATLRKLGERLKVRNESFWNRLDGKNQYCQVKHDARAIFAQDRYLAVNFQAYQRHKTVEVRVLPMFTSDKLARRFVRRILSFTEMYLRKKIATDSAYEVAHAIPMFEERIDPPQKIETELLSFAPETINSEVIV